MSSVLILVGFALLVTTAVGVVKGNVRRLGLVSRKQSALAAAGALAVMLAGGAMTPTAASDRSAPASLNPSPTPTRAEPSPETTRASSPTPTALRPSEAEETPSPVAPTRRSASPRVVPPSALGPLLFMAAGGDGDSWHDTHGTEYRVGLINTPESTECGGPTATAYRKHKLAAGFYARTYATDKYARKVAVVYTHSGSNLNVVMAREGIANDKYLAEFRHENPKLAQQLDRAFAQAKAERRGIWRTCASGGDTTSEPPPPPAPGPKSGSCHPDYRTCVPIKGDGSGTGEVNDLDCPDIRRLVYLRQMGTDPYRLDANTDGVGCEAYG